MPRPPLKRRQLHKQSPKFSSRHAHSDPSKVLQALERKLGNKPIGKVVADSDDSDNLVTTITRGGGRRTVARREVYASGGVGKGDEPGALPSKAQRTDVMMEATKTIIRSRSQSRSREASTGPTQTSVSIAHSPANSKSADIRQPATSPSHRTPRTSSSNLPKKIGATPLPDTSVLGALKPRRRQASILRQTRNDESSSIESSDEERFLPDDVSTPVMNSHQGAHGRGNDISSSLKRKRGSATIVQAHGSSPKNDTASTASSLVQTTETVFPGLTRTQFGKLRRQAMEEQDVLAPPESSPEPSPAKPRSPLIAKSEPEINKPLPLSTEQLQTLMPSKRFKSSRSRKNQDSFDIPEDSTSVQEDQISDEEEHSTFLPTKGRGFRRQRRQRATPAVKTNKVNANTINGNNARRKTTETSTDPATSTLTPTRLRIPLPLSSSRSRNTEAKSPLQKYVGSNKHSVKSQKIIRESEAPPRKRYGGSLRQTRGKENQIESLSDDISGDRASEDVEIEVGRGLETKSSPANETKEWKNKWAEIDAWDMAFEEVDVSTTNSSQLGG